MSSEEQVRFYTGIADAVKHDLCRVIENNKTRFRSWQKLVKRYDKALSGLIENGMSYSKSLVENHNELCTAVAILEDKTIPKDTLIEYEFDESGCDQHFDFRVTPKRGVPRWIEVKTIHPDPQDDWHKYESAMKKERLPTDTRIILNKDWLGGELYHYSYSSRGKMLDNALVVEDKIENCLASVEHKITILVQFSNGFHWHIDELEDFIYFYNVGRHFPGDPFAEMEDHFVESRKIRLNGSIQHFSFFTRPESEIRPKQIIWSVPLPEWPFDGDNT